MKKSVKKNGVKKLKNDVISSRRTCSADGIGLSHYVLVDKKAR